MKVQGEQFKKLQSEGKVLDKLPDGWVKICDATTAPDGYYWANNRQNPFSDKYRHALIRKQC